MSIDWPVITIHVAINLYTWLFWVSLSTYASFVVACVIEASKMIGFRNAARYPWLPLSVALFWPLFVLNRLAHQSIWPMNIVVETMNCIAGGEAMRRSIESANRRVAARKARQARKTGAPE